MVGLISVIEENNQHATKSKNQMRFILCYFAIIMKKKPIKNYDRIRCKARRKRKKKINEREKKEKSIMKRKCEKVKNRYDEKFS